MMNDLTLRINGGVAKSKPTSSRIAPVSIPNDMKELFSKYICIFFKKLLNLQNTNGNNI